MAYTVLKLITRSMRLLGVLEVGRTPTADEFQDGLEALNAMVDSWATERLAIYTAARLVFALNAAQQTYEIGPNADPVLGWVAQRPIYIEGAGLLYATGSETFERPIKILTLAEWRLERSKGLSTSIVTKLYYDYGFTNANGAVTGLDGAPDVGSGTVWVWPIPNAVGAIALYLPQAVPQFTSIHQTVALPPGYQRALTYNHAVEFAPEFMTEPSEVVIAIAQESKANIKRANVHLDKLRCDIAPSRHRFNIYSGERD